MVNVRVNIADCGAFENSFPLAEAHNAYRTSTRPRELFVEFREDAFEVELALSAERFNREMRSLSGFGPVSQPICNNGKEL
jgi:hypothetical protein